MTDPILSPHDIVAILRDPGLIDSGAAHRLENRIIAYAESRACDGRREGIAASVKRAAAAAAAIRGTNQRDAALKVLRAVERLLPSGADVRREAYSRGFKDGVEKELRRQRQTPDTR